MKTLARICKVYKEKYPLVQIVLHTATADTVYESKWNNKKVAEMIAGCRKSMPGYSQNN